MELMQIVILVFVFLVLLYFIINMFTRATKLTEMADGKILQTITADKLKNANNSNNFTYSMWIYVDDWNYNFGKPKTILDRANGPTVMLGDKPNTLTVNIRYYDTSKEATDDDDDVPGAADPTTLSASQQAACDACTSGYTCACAACNGGVPLADSSSAAAAAASLANIASAGKNSSISNCTVTNIPIQKWVNIIASLYGSTLDIYIDGKLVRTCILPGVPFINNNEAIKVTPDGGFSGWTTSFKYLPTASNPQEAYNFYKDGFGGSILGNALNKYRIKFSILKDNVETGGIQI